MKSTILLAIVLTSSQLTQVSIAETSRPDLAVVKKAQPSFSFVRGHRQGKATMLSWSMSSTAGVNGFEVQCTYEDPNDPYAVWDTKGKVAIASVRTFQFNDKNVFRGVMHYRVVAHLNNGSTIVSVFETVKLR
jgi:hypothetical protein